jgi:schlafen family protein
LLKTGVPTSHQSETLDYGSVQLRTEAFGCDELQHRLIAMNSTGRFTMKDCELPFELKNSWTRETFHPSFSEYHEWPGHLYQIGASQSSNTGLQPLVARGLTPYFHVRDAIQNWSGVSISDSDGRFRQFLLFVPRFDARLDALEFSKGVLEIRSSYKVRGLHLAVLASDGQSTTRLAKPLRKKQRLSLMPNPTSLRLFVVNDKSETLDSFAEEENWSTRHRVIFAGSEYPTELMHMIRGGETDAVEFKEFIRLDDKKKSADIIKAVISFANTAGGTILIGVTDDAEVVGVDLQVPHDKRKAATFAADYFRSVREVLKQKLNRIPPIEMHTEQIGDKTIFVIRVAEGSAKPYVNVQTKETFLRRGASDVRPDPDTELRNMLGSRGLMDWQWLP